jgi:hypothetical protein
MFWVCVLGKTKFPSYVGLKTVSFTALCVRIVVRFYRPNRQDKHSTPSGAESKNFSLYALLAGQGRL